MNEAKKTFDPFILLFSAVYLIVLLLSLYTHMYYGEYSTRDLSQEIYRYYKISGSVKRYWLSEQQNAGWNRISQKQSKTPIQISLLRNMETTSHLRI